MTDNLVAGVFTSRARAEAASKDLLRIGLTEHDVELGAPAPGRYRLEDREPGIVRLADRCRHGMARQRRACLNLLGTPGHGCI